MQNEMSRISVSLSQALNTDYSFKQLINFTRNFLHSIQQCRQIIMNGIPDDLQIDPKIFMSQQITKILHILPWYLWIFFLQLL